MNDESFARYQGHIVDLAIRNQGYLPSGMGVNEIGSSLSGLRSNVIEARNEELNKYASRRRPVGKKVDTISKKVKPKKYHTRIQNKRCW